MHFAVVISAMGLRVYANKEREILILPALMHYVCLTPVDQTHQSYASKTILMPVYKSGQFVLQHMNENSIQFPRNIPKTRFMLT